MNQKRIGPSNNSVHSGVKLLIKLYSYCVFLEKNIAWMEMVEVNIWIIPFF